MQKTELRDYLLEQDVLEDEVDEVLNAFNDNVTKDDLTIVEIFDTPWELGNSYIDNVVGTLDHHIDAVLDYAELGKHLAKTCEEYLLLENGRIIQFEL